MIDIKCVIKPEHLILLKNSKRRNSEIKKLNIELYKSAKAGCVKSRNYLFVLNIPNIINTISKNFKIRYEDMDGYINDSFFYYLEAIEDYNPDVSDNFIGFLQTKIRSRFHNQLYNKKKKAKSNNTVPIEDYEISEENTIERDIDLKGLTDDEKMLLKLHVNGKLTLKAVSRQTKLSYPKICKLKKSIKDKYNLDKF